MPETCIGMASDRTGRRGLQAPTGNLSTAFAKTPTSARMH